VTRRPAGTLRASLQQPGGNGARLASVVTGMRLLRYAARGVVAAVVVITVVGCGYFRERSACGCSPPPGPESAAQYAAVRFEDLLRRGDASSAWMLLTDGAQARYVDLAGFRPVADRLGAAYRDAGVAGRTGDWPAVDKRGDRSSTTEVAVARYAGSPQRLVSALVVHGWPGRSGTERVDPEPAAADLRVSAGERFALRVDLPPGGPEPARFVVVDAARATSVPNQWSVAPGAYNLSWAAESPTGPVLVIAAERTDSGWRIGAAIATMPDG
jgi:hypothetical protein